MPSRRWLIARKRRIGAADRFGYRPRLTRRSPSANHARIVLSVRYMLDWLSQNGIRTPESVLAIRGNKDARATLVRDNKLIRRLVLMNLHIYQVRLGLATNPKTPLVLALKQLSTLDERDLRRLAKSRNVPQTVAAQARRLILSAGRDQSR